MLSEDWKAVPLRELSEIEKDAARYRWLRGGPDVPAHSTRWPKWEVRNWDGRCWQTMFAESLDAAVDSAMMPNTQ